MHIQTSVIRRGPPLIMDIKVTIYLTCPSINFTAVSCSRTQSTLKSHTFSCSVSPFFIIITLFYDLPACDTSRNTLWWMRKWINKWRHQSMFQLWLGNQCIVKFHISMKICVRIAHETRQSNTCTARKSLLWHLNLMQELAQLLDRYILIVATLHLF